MKKIGCISFLLLLLVSCGPKKAELSPKKVRGSKTELVNVFLGTSGDYGQMSPSASSPLSMMSIGPVTHPGTHTGYDHYAKEFLGFVHTHIEGVGCRGGGGNILIKPLDGSEMDTPLTKSREVAQPGYYQVDFTNGIGAKIAVDGNYGVQQYHFPPGKKRILLDLSHAFLNRFVEEDHVAIGNAISGWVDTKTVCDKGKYRIYFHIEFDQNARLEPKGAHQFLINGTEDSSTMGIKIGFSSVSEAFAKDWVIGGKSLEDTKASTTNQWDAILEKVQVIGEQDRMELFYSLFYRALQAPYLVSEPDGSYRAIDGTLQKDTVPIYHGWAIWDNYREQMPLLSLVAPQQYGDIAYSIANLYRFGKNDWSTMYEPSNSVRTEHAQVVLLDALRKGHTLPLADIKDSLVNETGRLDFGSPDKALESSYDYWAFSQLMTIVGDTAIANDAQAKATEYASYWEKDFADMAWPDVDQMGARGLYQGTLWQYRWFVPFDIAGLKELDGGENSFREQLDRFFGQDNYNHANQPDLQVPGLYNATQEPWKSQKLFRNILLDTVVQFYFNNNSKGVDPYIGRIYNNRPKAFLHTMDDDLGTMSSWFVLRAMGLSAVNVGDPVYYLTAPIFESVELMLPEQKSFKMVVSPYEKDHFYVKSVRLNGKSLDRNWLTHQEIMAGGLLQMETDSVPNPDWGVKDPYLTKMP